MTNRLPMTPGRWVALVIGTPLALVAIGWTALTAVAFAGLGSSRVNLAVPFHGHTAVVNVDEGDITAGPGPAGEVRVHGTLHYSLIRPKLTWHRSGSTIALHARCQVPTGVCSVDYAVAVPPVARSELSTASGNLTASGLAGTVTLSTDSGDITVVFTKIPDLVKISDSSGNIKLVLPPGRTAYRVSASTSSGQTSIGVPQSPTSPHVISATDQSGNITISQ